MHFETHAGKASVGLVYLLHTSEKYIKQLKSHPRGSTFAVVAFSTDFLELVFVFRQLLLKSPFQLVDLILRKKGRLDIYKEFTQTISKSEMFFKNAVHIPF